MNMIFFKRLIQNYLISFYNDNTKNKLKEEHSMNSTVRLTIFFLLKPKKLYFKLVF